ncbi:hypothetical protein Btru_007905 [Bulinus truncatus]|nr:hypothetical protein Btru_007905 [Bulinus truncatus]
MPPLPRATAGNYGTPENVAASGESMYDDAFTIQYVEKGYVDDFNFVAGMVPFLLNLIKDAMEELRRFMYVNGLTNKNRQKLMRNLRVIDLLVKILQCPLDGQPDEMNLTSVFKEAYDTLYTYMIGRSRKNALYFAKYIDFFQTQFTQKNYRFLDLLHVLCVCDDVAIPNNQSYIVERWLSSGQHGVYLTARGQDINRQPNILYLSTSGGKGWVALHEFVDESNECYDQNKHDFLLHQLDLYKALCHGRNDFAINIITKELRFLTWEETFLSLRSDILPDAIRAKYCDLTTNNDGIAHCHWNVKLIKPLSSQDLALPLILV